MSQQRAESVDFDGIGFILIASTVFDILDFTHAHTRFLYTTV